jgi:MFS family permease
VSVSFVILGLPAIGPQLRDRFGLSLAALGALVVAVPLGSGLALLAADRALERFGSRFATRLGTTFAASGLALAALAHSTEGLFAGLIAAGVGASVVPIAGGAALFRAYPPNRRAWALGVRQMAVPMGGLIAAAAVPALASVGGTRLVLGIGAVFVGAVGMVFASVCDDEPLTPGGSARTFRDIWQGPGLARLFAVTLSYLFVLQTLLVYTVPAMRAAGFTKFEAGVAYFAVNVAAVVSRVVWGHVADREGGTRRRRTLMESGLMASAGALAFGAALHGGPELVLVTVVPFAFAAFGWNAIVYTLAGEWSSAALATRALAVAATVVFVGSSLVTPLVGAIAETVGWDALWALTALVGLAGAVAARSLPDRGGPTMPPA